MILMINSHSHALPHNLLDPSVAWKPLGGALWGKRSWILERELHSESWFCCPWVLWPLARPFILQEYLLHQLLRRANKVTQLWMKPKFPAICMGPLMTWPHLSLSFPHVCSHPLDASSTGLTSVSSPWQALPKLRDLAFALLPAWNALF